MEGSLPGPAVPPDQAAEALAEALAFRGLDATVTPGPQVTLPSGLVVGVEGDCYRWPVGAGLQIHPTSNPAGAAALVAEQEQDPLFRLRRRFPEWTIMQPIPGALIAVPASRRSWRLPSIHARSIAELAKALERADERAEADASAPPLPE